MVIGAGTANADFPKQDSGVHSPAVPGTVTSEDSPDSVVRPILSAHAPQPVSTGGGGLAQGARIDAIVQSIFTDVKVHGCNKEPTNEGCGKIRARIQCTHDPNHSPYYKHQHCNDPLCPICYDKFAKRIADGITDRMEGFRSVYHMPLYHLILWRDNKTFYKNDTEAFADGWRMAKDAGVLACSLQWHPARINKEIKKQLRRYRISRGLSKDTGFWEMAHDDVLNLGSMDAYCVRGDHFHGVATGYLENSKDYHERTGCGYKKVRKLSNDKDVWYAAHYVATHSSYTWGKQAVHYYGLVSNANLGKTKVYDGIQDVLCGVCSARMEEVETDDEGTPISRPYEPIHSIVTMRIKRFKYWKRVRRIGNRLIALQAVIRPDLCTSLICGWPLKPKRISAWSSAVWGPAGPPVIS